MASPHDDPPFSNGAFAVDLIGRFTHKLASLQGPVLADSDPEPLHQMRVALRRLRTCLYQFAPALQLPKAVADPRLAKTVRRLGMARDLDVLRERLERDLMPELPEAEQKALKPVLKQLRRERALAYEQVVSTLQSGGYLKLLSQLQAWLRHPELTPLGELPLLGWTLEWQAPMIAELFQHPGWFVLEWEGDMERVHDLRKRLKTARYGLENLGAVTGSRSRQWVAELRDLQELLGELNDLHVLEKAIDDQLPSGLAKSVPALDALLRRKAQGCWDQWRQRADGLILPERRRSLWMDLWLERRFDSPTEPALLAQPLPSS
ncbi:CHAD domain-containing protein [Synechococcus sp. CS-1332]|uniref:CHAD domain-containing protein n=1 Tax=Synechococcus sp. CS-1332 TaxID=2847972 RepID=UPI00223AF63B|nr:CHAD domain-containing protein [Synechococcus sp. CS-1332]MCT0206598.1 CHAD domain-containing protein [Synechococcus sp. CS-1332]